MFFQAGQRVPLSNLIGGALDFEVHVKFNASFPIDIAIFGVNSIDKLFADEYMIFFNNPLSPNGAVKLTKENNRDIFKFDLARHTEMTVEKFILCASVDHPTKTMKDISNGMIELVKHGKVVATFVVSADLFKNEKAVMLASIYHKNVWRFGSIGQGFDGGLPALVQYFGGEVEQSAEQQQTSKVDLRKKVVLDKVANASPKMVDLTKKSLISLEKKNLLGIKARIGLVLDRSGSMHNQYKRGDVQKVIDRILPLAVSFDDDGTFECWAFGAKSCRLDDVTLNNVNNYVDTTNRGWNKWPIGVATNYEPSAIQDVIEYYSKFNDGIPTFIIFVSDGGVTETKKITKLISESAVLPIFWQFVGIGGTSYGILQKLDEMTGRIIDNCNFFPLDKIDQYPDERLYDMLLNEFPQWLEEAKRKQIVRG